MTFFADFRALPLDMEKVMSPRTMMGSLPDYVIITPAKDEAGHLPTLIESVIAQTHRPLEFTIVDDGSSDETATIADYYAERHRWIRAIHCSGGQSRQRGAPVVRAFNVGLQSTQPVGEFVVKLDADLFIPPHYFEWIALTFRYEPKTGIAGGVVLTNYGRRWALDRVSINTVHGAAKSYRRACLESIGGLIPSMGWDGIDEYAARVRGWNVHVLTELQVLHYKPRGSKQPWQQARWEEGRASHVMGYRPAFLAARTLYRMFVERPPILGGLLIGASYCWHRFIGTPRLPDESAVKQLRLEQGRRLRGFWRFMSRKSLCEAASGPAQKIASRSVWRQHQ